MRSFLGVDVGGTNTRALIAREDGQILGTGIAGTGNHELVGYPGLAGALQQAVGKALQLADLLPQDIAGAGFGIAGYDWPSELPPTLEAVHTLGLACPIEIVNDTQLGLIAGASQGWGIVLVAGTGNNCRGRNAAGQEGRITGNGTMLGENGGASEIVLRAIQKVNHAWIRRSPPTRLTQMFLDLSGAPTPDAFLEGLVMETIPLNPEWARPIFQVAAEGDEAAQECIVWNARELGASACGVIRQLGMEDDEFEVVMAGSLFDGGHLFTVPLQETIRMAAPRAQFVRLSAPPVTGAVLLGMQAAGVDTQLIRPQLIESARSDNIA